VSRGRFIAFEGGEACGKSTQAALLADALDAVLTREPGGTAIGARVRSLVLDPATVGLSARAEALLMAADRAQHVAEVVAPALAAGRWVVTDRFSGSTLAYQGYGRGLDLDDLRRLVHFATGGMEPDLNVLVDVPVEVGRRRRRGGSEDRLEGLGDEFQERVRSGYLALAAADPGRWVVIDGVGHVEEVAVRLSAAVVARLGALPSGVT
jgi:dTMP kinase